MHEHIRHRPCHAGLDAVQCDTVRRGCSGLGSVARDAVEMAEAEEDCERGAGRRGICRSSACASKGHEQSAREHERWQGECGRAGAPYSVELVEPSACEFGSRTGDPPALHRTELCEDSKLANSKQAHQSEAKRSTRSTDRLGIKLQGVLEG